MKSLATWCVRHRLVVVLLWIAALVGMTLLSQGVGTAYSNNFSLPHTESTEALELLQAAAPKQAGDQERIVFHTTDGIAGDRPGVQAAVDDMLAKVARSPTSPSRRRQPLPAPTVTASHQVSADGRTAFVNVTFDVQGQNVDVRPGQGLRRRRPHGPGPAPPGGGVRPDRRAGRPAVRSAAPGSACCWPPSCCSSSSARSSPWPCPCCRRWRRSARPSA